MPTRQILFGILILVLTAALGLYYAWRQWQTLRGLRKDEMMPNDERSFLRNQAWRRLVGAVLMLIFAALFLTGMFFLEVPTAELVQKGEELVANNQQRNLTDSERQLVWLYLGYWIVLLLLVLGFIAIAGYEIYAIRRFSVSQMRRIQDERREMIATETARLRRERNGHA